MKEKGFDILIDAWKDIDEKLIILGSGRLKKNLLKQIKDTSQESKIFIEESVSKNEMDEFYSRAKMLIISSRREGCLRGTFKRNQSNFYQSWAYA